MDDTHSISVIMLSISTSLLTHLSPVITCLIYLVCVFQGAGFGATRRRELEMSLVYQPKAMPLSWPQFFRKTSQWRESTEQRGDIKCTDYSHANAVCWHLSSTSGCLKVSLADKSKLLVWIVWSHSVFLSLVIIINPYPFCKLDSTQ